MSNKKNDDYQLAGPPPKTTFKQFLYNPSTKEVLGRTAKSWFQILVFYVVLYAFLAGFFGLLMFVFFKTLETDRPKWTQKDSLIGNNPGMGFRPMHPDADVLLLEFDKNNAEDLKLWKKNVNDFLAPYKNSTKTADNMCDYTTRTEAPKTCYFQIPVMTNCTEANSYGFADGNPCVFLKMNKIFGWEPKPYTYEEIQSGVTEEKVDLNMPELLKNNVVELGQINGQVDLARKKIVENNVWVSCYSPEKESSEVTWTYDGYSNDAKKGESAFDDRYPIMGFPSFYYPYTQQSGYLSPFVVVQFFNLPKGVEVKMSCQLWAKGITIDRQRRLGMTNIEIKSK